jgi:hypothetical protein
MKKLKKEDLKKLRDSMKKGMEIGYLKEAAAAFSPKKYSSLGMHSVWHGAKYVMIIMLLAFLLMSVISVPMLFRIPGTISSELGKFDTLNFTGDVEMSAPVMFTETDPQIIIDTTGQITEMTTEKLLITEDFLLYRPYNKIVKINISELQDVTGHTKELSNLITFITILIIPSILITSYIVFLIKYIILILLMTLVVFVFSRMIKKDIGIRKSLMTAIYASTPMIIMEVLFIPFNSRYLIHFLQILGVNFYLIPILLFLSLAVFASFFAGKNPKGSEKFVEVEEVEWDF